MGMFQRLIKIDFETLNTILQGLITEGVPESQQVPFIVRLRGTWFLERVARNQRLFGGDDRQDRLKQIFEPLCDYFSKTDQFVFKYQSLITVLAYLRQIRLMETYPDNYASILQTLCNKVVELIDSCNSETVQTPVDSLIILARTDRSCAQLMGPLVLQQVLNLFDKYNQDAMLSSDILSLIKILGDVDDTTTFRGLVLPAIVRTVTVLQQAVSANNM